MNKVSIRKVKKLAPVGGGGIQKLLAAAKSGKKEDELTIALLLEKGNNINCKDSKTGWNALRYAAMLGLVDMVTFLLNKGADIASVDDGAGCTALHGAAFNGHVTTVTLLLEWGADKAARSNFGKTALHFAARYGHETTATLLLDRGANIADRDIYGKTALHFAARFGQESIVTLLLDRGADTAVKDIRGRSPVDLAVKHYQWKTASLISTSKAAVTQPDASPNTPKAPAPAGGSLNIVSPHNYNDAGYDNDDADWMPTAKPSETASTSVADFVQLEDVSAEQVLHILVNLDLHHLVGPLRRNPVSGRLLVDVTSVEDLTDIIDDDEVKPFYVRVLFGKVSAWNSNGGKVPRKLLSSSQSTLSVIAEQQTGPTSTTQTATAGSDGNLTHTSSSTESPNSLMEETSASSLEVGSSIGQQQLCNPSPSGAASPTTSETGSEEQLIDSNIAGNMETVTEDKQDGTVPVCGVCLDDNSYEDDNIVLCNQCHAAVHQSCYSISTISEEEGEPSWDRYKLACALCSSEGACIQCCSGRCTAAAHPWCVVKDPQGFTRRTVTNSNGNTVWEIFCQAHARAVYKPYDNKKTSAIDDKLSCSKEEATKELAKHVVSNVVEAEDDPVVVLDSTLLQPCRQRSRGQTGTDLQEGPVVVDSCHPATTQLSPQLRLSAESSGGLIEEAILDVSSEMTTMTTSAEDSRHRPIESSSSKSSSSAPATHHVNSDRNRIAVTTPDASSRATASPPIPVVWASFVRRRHDNHVSKGNLLVPSFIHDHAAATADDDEPVAVGSVPQMPLRLPPPVLLSGRKRTPSEAFSESCSDGKKWTTTTTSTISTTTSSSSSSSRIQNPSAN